MYIKIKNPTIIFILLISLSIANVSPDSQSNHGSIEGMVISGDNEPLVGANIYISNLERGASSDSQGRFSLEHLPAGTYTVAVKFIGYRSDTRLVRVTAGTTSQIQFVLYPSVLESEPVVVTGRPIAAEPLHSPQEIISISGAEKKRLQSASLGKTIESIPGVYNMSTGSVAGKPVIRGQTSERMLILADGVVQEYQQYGERHAPNIDPFSAERVEIIKGPASLLYGSDALGGAVNLIPNRFMTASGQNAVVSGSFSTAYHSNNNETMGGIKIGVVKGRFGLNGSLVYRNAGNFHTPAIEPFSQTGQRGDPKFTGEIEHTDFKQLNGSLGAGLLTAAGLWSITYDHYNNDNNFLLPDGNPIGLHLQNQIINVKSNIPLGRFILKPKFSYQRNQRQAADPGKPYTVLPDSASVNLLLNVYNSRLELEHAGISGFTGVSGVDIKYYDHENNGLVPLQPTGHFFNFALFSFEEWQSDKLTLDFGIRLDGRRQTFNASPGNPLLPEDEQREYFSLTGAFGGAYRLTKQLTTAVNIGRGFRTPSFYNLYVYGYHGGVFAFQIGEPDLQNETSWEISTSLRFRSQRAQASATLFQNRISHYIFLYNAPDHPLAPAGEPFVFAHDQADAVLTGLDWGFQASVFDWLILSVSYSVIRSKFSEGPYRKNELPLMPADRLCGEVKLLLPDIFIFRAPYFLINLKHVGDKSAAGIYEPFGQFDDGIGPDIPFGVASTKAYSLVNLGLGFNLNHLIVPFSFDFEVSNLLDNDYRDFLDTYKGYTLSPGRSLNFRLHIPVGN